MVADIRQRGYEDGYKAAKQAKASGTSVKTITKTIFVDDRKIAAGFMEEFKAFNVRWSKCFTLAVAYSFGYDRGVAEAAYETD